MGRAVPGADGGGQAQRGAGSITGALESIIRGDIGPIEVRQEAPLQQRRTPETYKEDLLEQIEELVPGTDGFRDENDVLLVVNTALDEFGVRTISDFTSWLARQEALMKMSGELDQGDPQSRFSPEPFIRQLAKYLRARKLTLSTARMIR